MNMLNLRSFKTGMRPLIINCLLIGGLIVSGVVISCTNVNRTIMAPTQIAGATYKGVESCSECHAEKVETFTPDATHSWIQGSGTEELQVGCETCHGPGSVHIESGGAAKTIVNPGRSPETCFQCHVDKQSEFRLPNRHPVLEGQVSCSDCHEPHGGQMIKGGDLGLASQNETCFECHTAQRGPFAFEHEALRDGCTTCHSPHGSVNQKMLKARNANLCLQCHGQEQTAEGEITIGSRNHVSYFARGTCWNAGCHEGIHGSHSSERLRY